jgi:O-antigen/teichoic acid export membrane protein
MSWSSGPAMRLMLGRTAGFIATFFIPVVLVRVLDVAEFGTYKQLFLLFATIFPLAQIGMAESLFYFLPSAERRGRSFLVNATLGLAASGLVCLLVLTAGRSLLASWMSNPRLAEYVPLIGVYLLFMLVSAVLEIALVSRGRYGTAALTYVGSDVARAALMLMPALLLGSLRWLIYGAVAFATMRVLATLGYLRAAAPGQEALRPSRRLMRAQLAYTMPFQLAVVFEILQANVHHYAVSYTFDAATYAIYAVGCLQIPLVDFIGSSVCNVLMVKMRAAAKAGDRPAVLGLWHAATAELALIFLPLTAFLIIVAGNLVTLLFTDSYAAAVPVFIVWSLSILLSILQTDGFLRVHAQTRFLVLMNVARLIVVLASVGWLMARLGLPGAALATIAALAVGKAMALVRMGRIMEVPVSSLLPWGTLLAVGGVTAAAAAPTALLTWASPWSRLPLLIAAAVVFWGCFAIGAAWLDLLPAGVREICGAWRQRLRPMNLRRAARRGNRASGAPRASTAGGSWTTSASPASSAGPSGGAPAAASVPQGE